MQVSDRYDEYFVDEAGIVGRADKVFQPTSVNETVHLMKELAGAGVTITPQGARTGVACGAIPTGGALVNLTAMQRVLGLRRNGDDLLVNLEQGVTLEQMNRQLAANRFDTDDWDQESLEVLKAIRRDGLNFMFPPNPSETTATLGGVVACNASGSHIFGYGEARNWVHQVRVVLADGTLYDTKDKPTGAMADALALAREQSPSPTGAGGYATGGSVTPAGLFCGSEGTLGTLMELTLRLIPAPVHRWGILAFFNEPSELTAFMKCEAMIRRGDDCVVAAAEFFHASALALLDEGRAFLPVLKALPDIPICDCALFVELNSNNEASLMDRLEEILNALNEISRRTDETLAATTPKDFTRLAGLSHGLMEAINFRATGDGLPPQAIDILLPEAAYGSWVERLAVLKVPHSMHGSFGCGHLHLQLFGDDAPELLLLLTEELGKNGALPAAAYGCGRLKTRQFNVLAGGRKKSMVAIKMALDPHYLLQPGVFFEK